MASNLDEPTSSNDDESAYFYDSATQVLPTFMFSVPKDCEEGGLRRPKETKHLEIEFENDEFDDNDCAPLLAHIRHSPSLRHVDYGIPANVPLTNWINAAAENRCIEELTVYCSNGDYDYGSAAVAAMLRTTKTLAKLNFDVVGNEHHPDVCAALQENKTLKSLSITHLCDHTVGPVVECLQGNRRIRSLGLGVHDLGVWSGSEDIDEELITSSRVLKKFSVLLRFNTVLSDVTLSFLVLKVTGVGRLLQGIPNQCSLSSLTFSKCSFSPKAMAAFVSYMQGVNVVAKRSLQSLCFEACRVGTCYKESPALDRQLARMLKGPCGSLLVSVNYRVHKTHEFWASLETDAKHQSRSLLHLQIGQGKDSLCEFQAAARHIPNLLYLRSLKWELPGRGINSRELLQAFRQNGSLHAVDVVFKKSSAWTPKEKRRLKAYGKRNRLLPRLLNSSMASSTPISETDSSTTDQDLLLPYLFDAAQDIPQMKHRYFFLGLMKRGQSIFDPSHLNDGAAPVVAPMAFATESIPSETMDAIEMVKMMDVDDFDSLKAMHVKELQDAQALKQEMQLQIQSLQTELAVRDTKHRMEQAQQDAHTLEMQLQIKSLQTELAVRDTKHRMEQAQQDACLFDRE